MDDNKLQRLENCGYRIRPCCGFCMNSKFASIDHLFGTCAKIHYKHLKHTGEERELSVNRHGVCRDLFEMDAMKTVRIVKNFIWFVEKDK
jgi:hypothetical protein